MTLRPWPCLALALSLAGCVTTEVAPTSPPAAATAATSTSGAYDPGPVVLTLGGQGASQCKFTLFARYPENLAPHTRSIRSLVTSTATDFSSEGGFFVELPMLGVDWTEMTPAGVLTALTDGSAAEACARLRGVVEVAECYQGDCPEYVADPHSEIDLTVKASSSR